MKDAKAKIAVILDGPKETMAEQLAWRIRNETALVVIDDEGLSPDFRDAWPHATAESNDPSWQAIFPLRLDAASISRPPNPLGFGADARMYHARHDKSSFSARAHESARTLHSLI